MKKYIITGKIVLSFIFDDVQKEYLLDGQKNEYLESSGTTVWYITADGTRHESITTANIIDVALKRNDIKEIE